MKPENGFSNHDLDFLAREFARWQHPVVRHAGQAFLAGGGDPGRCRELFQLLEAFLLDPTPERALLAHGQDPYGALHEQFVRSLHDLLALPVRDQTHRERLTKGLLLSVEPLFQKFLAVFDEEDSRRMASKGLGAALVHLSRKGRLPPIERLDEEAFKAPDGWQDRSSYHNALRDVLPGRLDGAHRAMHANPQTWASVVVTVLGLLDINVEAFRKAYGTKIQAPAATRPGGLPLGLPDGYRTHPGAPEPLSTREAERESFRARISEALQGSPRLEVLQCVPGWGKTTFLAAALDGLPVTVRVVDLKDCTSPHHIAEALLEGCELSEDGSDEVDERPLAAVKILGQRMAGRGIVAFINANKTRTGKVSPALIEFADRLVERGHSVVLEGWGGSPLQTSKLGQGCIGRLTKEDLPPLHDEEISLWGQRILGRALTQAELKDLQAFDGHPALLRWALELLAERYPLPDEAASSADLLEVALNWDALQDEFQRFALSELPRIQKTAGEDYLPLWAKAWFGLLPWARVGAENLPPEMATRLRWFRTVGLVEGKDGSYGVGPWGKVIGIRHCLEEPGGIPSVLAFLQQTAAGVPPARVDDQRRHLLRMLVWLPDQDALLKGLLERLPLPALDAPVEAAEGSYYQAPLEPEVVEAALGPHPGQPGGTGEAGPLPPDLLLQLVESAARSNAPGAFQAHLASLLGTPEAVAYCLGGWRNLKQLHTALVRAPLSATLRCDAYSVFCRSMQPAEGDGRPAVAQRAWLARFLAGAADAFLRGNRLEACRAALETGESLQNSTRGSAGDPFAEAMHADTDYRLARLRLHLEVEPEAILAGHLKAIGAILPLDRQRPAMQAGWTLRLLGHLQEVAKVRPLEEGQCRRLSQSLASLQDLDLFLTAEQVKRRNGDGSTQILDLLHQEAARRLSARELPPADRARLECLAAIVFDAPVAQTRSLAWATEAAATRDFGAIDVHAFRLSVQSAFRLEHQRKKVAEICQGLLDRMLAADDPLHGSEFRERLTSTCLHYLTSHAIGAGDEGAALPDPSSEDESRLIRAERLVDAAYSKHLKATGSAWLWEEWCSQKLALARRRNALERRQPGRKAGAVAEAGLGRFLRDCREALGDHPAAAMVGLMVSRYLWQVEDLWPCFQRLEADRTLELPKRMKVLKSMIDFLSIHLLSPIDDRRIPEAEGQFQVFSAILREYGLYAGSGPQQDLMLLVRSILGPMDDPEHWDHLVKRGEALLATPRAYWRQVLEASLSHPAGLGEGSGIEDLTDPFTLSIASRIFRHGAGRPGLEASLRTRLAELSVVSAFAADQWGRSFQPNRKTHASLQVGLALGTALALSEQGRIFGTSLSHETTRKGHPLTWHDLMHREFHAATQMAVGRLKGHCQAAWDLYRERTRPRDAPDADPSTLPA